jgi:glutamate synthase domain-containing protein 2
MRACGSNNCPVGIATQKESLRSRLVIDGSARQLFNFFDASNDLIKVIARACGYNNISKFNINDLSTFDHDLYRLAGVPYAGMNP